MENAHPHPSERAYHGSPALKEELLARVAVHAASNDIPKRDGSTRRPSPFHAPGATSWVRDSAAPYLAMERQWGIPQMLARLEDVIYQGIPYSDAMAWPRRFAESMPVGADLSRVGWRFLHGILTEAVGNIQPEILLLGVEVREALGQCAEIVGALASGEKVDAGAALSAARYADGVSLVERSARRMSLADAALSATYAARSAEYAASNTAHDEGWRAMAAEAAAMSSYVMHDSVAARFPIISALFRNEDVDPSAAVSANEAAWSPQATLLIRLLREAI